MTSSLLVVTPILPAKLYHVSNLRSSDAGDLEYTRLMNFSM